MDRNRKEKHAARSRLRTPPQRRSRLLDAALRRDGTEGRAWRRRCRLCCVRDIFVWYMADGLRIGVTLPTKFDIIFENGIFSKKRISLSGKRICSIRRRFIFCLQANGNAFAYHAPLPVPTAQHRAAALASAEGSVLRKTREFVIRRQRSLCSV